MRWTGEAEARGEDRVIFEGASVRVGRFRCPTDDARFGPWDEARAHLLVFPRTSVFIEHEGRSPVVGDPNHVMLYNAGQVYRRSRISERGDMCEFFAFDPSVLVEAVRTHDPSVEDRPERPLAFLRGPCSREAYAAQRLVYRHVTRCESPDAMLVEETMLAVVDDVVGAAHAARGGRGVRREDARTVRRMEDVARLLNERFTERLGLEAIAEDVGLSMYHLCREFKRHMGESIHRYLTRLRLRTALEGLRPGADLTSLALSLGFSSHSHFTDAFRREYGLTPSRYRDPETHADREAVRRVAGGLGDRSGADNAA